MEDTKKNTKTIKWRIQKIYKNHKMKDTIKLYKNHKMEDTKTWKGRYNKNLQKPYKRGYKFYCIVLVYGFCVDMPEDGPGTSTDM